MICEDGYYPDILGDCSACHEDCKRCYGPDSDNCEMCPVDKIYYEPVMTFDIYDDDYYYDYDYDYDFYDYDYYSWSYFVSSCEDSCPSKDDDGNKYEEYDMYGPSVCVSADIDYDEYNGDMDELIALLVTAMNVNERGDRYENSYLTVFSMMMAGLLMILNF